MYLDFEKTIESVFVNCTNEMVCNIAVCMKIGMSQSSCKLLCPLNLKRMKHEYLNLKSDYAHSETG
jgi:hypothetical protein